MQLPILKTPSAAASNQTLIRYFHQTERDWSRHLAEEALLDVGTAFCNPQLANVWDANCILDAALPEGVTAAEAMKMASEHFDANRAALHRWVMNPSAAPESTVPLTEHLISTGYRPIVFDVLYLAHLPRSQVVEVGGLRIIPSRASYRHTQQLAEQIGSHANVPALADATMEHVQDPHFDSLLALKGDKAIAIAGVLAVGEIGRIEQVFVSENHRRQGVGRTMMSRMLEICARSLFKHILLRCRQENEPARHMYTQLGFVKVGEMTQYTRL